MEDKEKTKEELLREIAVLKSRLSDLQELEEKYKKLETEFNKNKEELDIQTWGVNKTNEAIKFLYKELEKKNKELQELDKLKSDFINTVSHELRTPLTTIKESISQVFDGLYGQINEGQREFLSICLEDVGRLRRIVDDLLDVSKIEAGKFMILKEEVDIISLARRAIVMFEPQAKVKNLALKENITNEEAIAYVDRDSVIRVFSNLISNALKFTERGHIEVSVVDKEECIECFVADTGRGIAEDDLFKVFGKFQQFGSINYDGERGTGLGLNICKSIIELNRGKIWVESTLNKGTKFTFVLPKYNAKEQYNECIVAAIKKAIRQKTPLSILVFGIKDFASFCNIIGNQKSNSLLHNIEVLIKSNLRSTDAIVGYAQKILAVLLEVEKKGALEITDRTQGIIRDYLSKDEVLRDCVFFSKVINYPEDVTKEEQMHNELQSILAQ